jgi:hypothetical protein
MRRRDTACVSREERGLHRQIARQMMMPTALPEPAKSE